MSHEKGRSMRGSAAHHSRETQTERGLSIPRTVLLEINEIETKKTMAKINKTKS